MVALAECEWFLFFLFFLPLDEDEPLGRLGLRLIRSGWGTGAVTGAGLGKIGAGAISKGPVETDIVRDLAADFGFGVGGWRLKVVSTNSSSNFLRFIVRDELQMNNKYKKHF